MTFFNPHSFRQQFPALNNCTIYLDNASTTLKPQAVIDATQQLYASSGGSVHRSQFADADHLTARYEHTRHLVAQRLNAPTPLAIIWCAGTTDAINLVADSYLRPRLRAGDEIVVSAAEHHANLVPWLMLAEQTQARVIKWPLNKDHIPDITLLPGVLNSRTRLVALGQMSNVTGGCPDIAEATRLAHACGAKVMIDGAQGMVHCPPDVESLDIDFYAFSAHKMYGPTGTGVLYGKPSLLADMLPCRGGGKMLTRVSFSGFTAQQVPWRFEAGTPNIAGVIGLSAALEWLSEFDLAAAEAWSCGLAALAEQRLAALPGFRSFRRGHSSLLSFSLRGAHHHDLVTLLAEHGIALRAGHHCAQPLMAELGVAGTVRASFAPYNTRQDVDALVSAIHNATRLLEE